MEVKLEEISKLKPGRYMMMDNCVCEILSMDKSAPGKHGHAKYRVTGRDILTGNKKQGLYSGHDKVGVPIIEKKNAQVLSISGDKAQLMDLESYETFEADIPEEFKDQIQANQVVVYWIVSGVKVIKQIKGET